MEVMSPLVSTRIWAVPASPAAVKFLAFLVAISEPGGALPMRQREMAESFGKSQQSISLHLAALCDLNIVLRPPGDQREGNSYSLHPFAAKYESTKAMEDAFRQALTDIKEGRLPNLLLPAYKTAPPSPSEEKPKLHRVA
ncbi:LexA family transcriptional regulator [Kitasatospora cineracea]|uniref:hypothetical protein n=1 Tax=Kitasatospora cineracea TaxID=88074 RepID=UPI0033D6E87F